MPSVLISSALNRKISSHLITPFNIMTTFFFRRSVEKAFQLDESPTGLSLQPTRPLPGQAPYIVSAVDDVMYIVSTVLQRTLSTSQRDVISSVVPTISRVLGSDFIGMIQRKMRDESYPKPLVSGGFPPEDKIIAFIVLINSLDIANDYLARIIDSRLASPSSSANNETPTLTSLFPFDHDVNFVANALRNLGTTFETKTSELLSDGLHVLFNQVIKPRLRPLLSDTFRDIDYTLSDAAYADLDAAADSDDSDNSANTDVTARFSAHWAALMVPLSRLLTPASYTSLLENTAKYLAHVLEKRIWAIGAGRIGAMGAVRLERDFSGIVGVMVRGRYALREAFGRVGQICMVVGMEAEEWDEVDGEGAEGGSDVVWVLGFDERRRARALVAGGD